MQPIDPPTAFSMDFFSLKGKTAIIIGALIQPLKRAADTLT